MIIEERIRKSAEALFDLEHRRFAARLGLHHPSMEHLPVKLVTELVYAVDELAWSADPNHSRLAVQLIALMWEHADEQLKSQLREFFVVSLSRLGVAPATVMVDDDFRETGLYGAFRSYSGALATLAMQLSVQVRVGKTEYQFTRFQRRAFDAISNNRLTGISAPTSAGKSFAIYVSIAAVALQSDQPVVYIVPTISLVNQVSEDIRAIFDRHGLQEWVVSNTFVGEKQRTAFVLTQERAIIALENGLGRARLSMLVVDEVQNLERVTHEDELRSKILYDFLHEVSETADVSKIVLSGPRLDNVGFVGSDIFGTQSAEERAIESPVANLTYAIEKNKKGFVLDQFRDALGDKTSLQLSSPEFIKGIGQTAYTDDFYEYLSHVVSSLGSASRNLIFSPTTDQARRTALKLAGDVQSSAIRDGRLSALSDYLANSVHPKHSLVETVLNGVAFHTGKVPPHARLAIEQAFSDGLLKNIVCTTTLMQGVNLPADVVLIRNPKLYVKNIGDSGAELSAYEFANLRGRAGRLLRDFVGRTVVLDEGSFKSDDAQADLFADTHKSLRLGYGDLFATNNEEILAELASPGKASSPASKFLAGHIRQVALRYGDAAQRRLHAVGIELPSGVIAKVEDDLSEIDVDREVLLLNRYWDPFDIQRISDHLSGGAVGTLPNDVWSPDVVPRVSGLIEFQAAVSPTYFKRYFGSASSSSKFAYLVAKSAESWGRERPLRTIIEDRHFNGDVATKVDDQVSIIYRQVIYGLTALLKPIADLQGSGEALLAAFESGVYHPATRYLISLGLYRETAVHVKRKLLPGISAHQAGFERFVDRTVTDGLSKLDPWTQRQVRATVARHRYGGQNG